MKGSTQASPYLVAVASVFVTALVVANIIAVKIASFGRDFYLPAAVIVFPVSYIVGDVLTEVYGYRLARKVIWIGFGCNLLAVGAIWAGQQLPSAPFWTDQGAYEHILGYAPRLLGASFVGYLAGEFSNSMVLSRMKVLTDRRFLWSRTITSTIIGEGLDSALFISIAFAGTIPRGELAEMIYRQWSFKVVYEIVATPVTYLVVGWLKRVEGVDVLDTGVNLSPVAVWE